jgi:type VI protein secretion system component VasF
MLILMNKSKRLDEFVGGIEDLLARLPDSLHPEIVALRDRVDAEIMDAWTRISRERAQRLKLFNRATSRPAVIVGLALLAAASLLSNRLAQSRALKQR